jgi:uncharacterized sulfatase
MDLLAAPWSPFFRRPVSSAHGLSQEPRRPLLFTLLRCVGMHLLLVTGLLSTIPEAVATSPTGNPGAAGRPNILWLTSEDHGPQMGCYGDTLARTPHVDRLAREGIRFNHVWSNHPVCAPARTTLITGLHATSLGAIHMRSMVAAPVGMRLFPALLRDAGYYCSNRSKEDYNVPTPADTWNESSARGHWRQRRPGQPFFAVFNSNRSHEGQLRTRNPERVTDPARVRIPAYHPDTPEVRQDWARYYDMVSEADREAGERLKELAEDGLTDDTIVFYFSDHGSGMPRSKRWPSDSGLRVPLVVYFPPKWLHLAPDGYTAGGESNRLVSFVDFAPTVLSLADLPAPEWMEGRAFAGTRPQPAPDFLFGARGRMDERTDLVRSVTNGRFVYVRNFLPLVSQGQHLSYQFETPTTRLWRERFDRGELNEAQSLFWRTPKPTEELFDLATDPDEVRNLAQDPAHRDRLATFRAALDAHLRATRDISFLPEAEQHARAEGIAPHTLARDNTRYPFDRILAAAHRAAPRAHASPFTELGTATRAATAPDAAAPTLETPAGHRSVTDAPASDTEPETAETLDALLTDSDSAVRFWGVQAVRVRSAAVLAGSVPRLRALLDDESPSVRIAAARALAGSNLIDRSTATKPAPVDPTEGNATVVDDHTAALATLSRCADPKESGYFISLAALEAIDSLGDRSKPLHPILQARSWKATAPHPRYQSYPARLLASITGIPTQAEPIERN